MGKSSVLRSLVYGFLAPWPELICVTGSLPPSTQDVEHTLTVAFPWSEICSVHWNSTGNWRQRRRKRIFVNDWLSATAARRLGVIPNWKICLLFINVLTPSHTALSLPRSDDSLNFWHFSFLKEMKHQSPWSQVCFRMGNENILTLNILKPSQFISLIQTQYSPATCSACPRIAFLGNYGCSWTFEAFRIHFSLSLCCLYFLMASFLRGEMNKNLPHRWANSGSSTSPTLN